MIEGIDGPGAGGNCLVEAHVHGGPGAPLVGVEVEMVRKLGVGQGGKVVDRLLHDLSLVGTEVSPRGVCPGTGTLHM